MNVISVRKHMKTMPSAHRRKSNEIQAARSKHFHDTHVVIERLTRHD